MFLCPESRRQKAREFLASGTNADGWAEGGGGGGGGVPTEEAGV